MDNSFNESCVQKEHTGILPVGRVVVAPQWVGKVGIFKERYQSYFSDLIGCCGKKELKILDMSHISNSGVEVLDYINIGSGMFIFKLRYLDPGELRA